MTRTERGAGSVLLLWLALLAGFSPALAELASYLRHEPHHLHVLVSPLLVLLALGSPGRKAAAPPAVGLALVAAGVGLLLVGIAGDAWSLARFSLPVAGLGLALVLTRPPPLVACLLFGLVPIPATFEVQVTPWLESRLADLVVGVLSTFGVGISASGPMLRAGERSFELQPYDTGFLLLPVLAQLGWFTAARDDRSFGVAVARAVQGALLTAPFQTLAVLLAAGGFAAGAPLGLLRAWLSFGVWIVAGLGGLALLGARRAAR